MDFKKNVTQNLIPIIIMLIIFLPSEAYAAGWLDCPKQNITLGSSVNASIKTGDYKGLTESTSYSSKGIETYWHIYKFSIPEDGLLNIYIESASASYLDYYYHGGADGFVIFSVSNPDEILWRSMNGENRISKNYSASRAMYYGSTEISLNQGDYYFAVRQKKTNDIPYYLTLSYRKPVINVTSITLNPPNMSITVGNQGTVNATVLPINSTDPTIIWESSDPSVATVNDGIVTGVSNGTASITATSADGEISGTCKVKVTCIHTYQVSVAQADSKTDGYIVKKCTKCMNQIVTPIYAIKKVNLSAASFTYNGMIRHPSVIVYDSKGNVLQNGTDYNLYYPHNAKNVGKYTISVVFTGNYKGNAHKTFTIIPKTAAISKMKITKKGLSITWKKQKSQISGYEIAYSTKSGFPKKSTYTILAGKNSSSKTIPNTSKGKRYYVRIRTYKRTKINGKYTIFYSNWSKTRLATAKG